MALRVTVLVAGSLFATVDADGPLMVNPCRDASSPHAKMPFCDASLGIDERIEDMIKRLSVDDKIKLMNQDGPALPQLGLNGYRWWEEATHGISPPRNGDKTPYETNFPFPITTGMSFNRTMWRKTGEQIARESRAFANVGDEFSTFWTPVVNLAREPRWGRNIETPGEDPYLSGEYATHFVQGFQEAPEDPGHIMASACCKHYVANEMEKSTVAGHYSSRHLFDAAVTMQDLVDSYLVPFQACVEKGRVTSLMCSYNAVNGVPSCANDWLLTTVARDSWGFDGAIVSDCDADADVFNDHNYTKTPEETVRAVLRAGTDVDCGEFVSRNAASALQKGMIVEGDLDDRLRFQFRLRMRLGHFDPLSPLDAMQPKDVVCTEYSKALSRDGAAQSAALLKNDDGALPLRADQTSFVVISPLDNVTSRKRLAGYYGGSQPCDMKFWSLADTVGAHASKVQAFLGLSNVSATGVDANAVAAARTADRVILGIGTDLSIAAEGHDTASIVLPAGQVDLVKQVAAAAKEPIVVIVFSAVALDLSDVLSNPKVGAVLYAGQPSVAIVGLGDVLFGLKSPAGRMVQTLYPKAYADQISIFDFNMRPGPSTWPRPDCKASSSQNYSHCPHGTNPGRTHRFYVDKPVVPFGFGLSYTSFKYTVVGAPAGPVSLAPISEFVLANGSPFLKSTASEVKYTVNVTNTGNMDADDVVLGFLKPPQAGINGVPLQVLFGFERVHVKAGQTETVWLYPEARDFTQVDCKGNRFVMAGDYTVQFGVPETASIGMGFAQIGLRTMLTEVAYV